VGLLTTDKNPADDMAVVAAMCLIKLSGAPPSPVDTFSKDLKRPDLQRLLQATALLEHAASNSKANPELSLLLVRLYQSLGAGSLAMRSYNRLGVKQIQGDTLGYVLFDRISSLHPHSVTDEGDVVDPSTQLSNIQQVYRKFRGQISSNSWKSFEYGNYDSIFQLLEVNEKLSLSAASVMSTVERRRIARITGSSATIDTTSHGYDILCEYNPINSKAGD
jgi:N-terminal acetyltransferase B complex non-catalytic subunit